MSALPFDNLQRVSAWGLASGALCHVHRPTDEAGVRRVFELARRHGLSVGFRGGGQSYGDAALNGEALLLDLSGMQRVLDWEPENGVITTQTGVTIEQLWRKVLPLGWWPPVTPGTMHPTLGGCAAMNIHGKNHWRVGSFGEHVLAFSALLPTGEVVRCSRAERPELFHGMLGAFGTLGCFLSLTLQMKRVQSGSVRVRAFSAGGIEAMLEIVDAHKEEDYVVGWMDCISAGRTAGRGIVHTARCLLPTESGSRSLGEEMGAHELPAMLFGILPRERVWRLLRPLNHRVGWKLINSARYHAGRWRDGHSFTQSLPRFNFLLDHVPHWRRAFIPGGLIQYQCFIPAQKAAGVFGELLRRCQERGLPAHLGVLKRHRADEFLVSCNLDGFSLALDFRVSARNRAGLTALAAELDEIVLQAGGRFYFAKDSTLRPHATRAFLGPHSLQQLAALKRQCDPEGLLHSNLSRRVLPELYSGGVG
ncbi:MAG TPA: FAD-binding oxidoreductase [Anaerolineales bacterium]|jgi:FAD/FMN-containing dehydrogenase|nr:FAD-binding oxidoreductase [Anaerolineales bacterium]